MTIVHRGNEGNLFYIIRVKLGCISTITHSKDRPEGPDHHYKLEETGVTRSGIWFECSGSVRRIGRRGPFIFHPISLLETARSNSKARIRVNSRALVLFIYIYIIKKKYVNWDATTFDEILAGERIKYNSLYKRKSITDTRSRTSKECQYVCPDARDRCGSMRNIRPTLRPRNKGNRLNDQEIENETNLNSVESSPHIDLSRLMAPIGTVIRWPFLTLHHRKPLKT